MPQHIVCFGRVSRFLGKLKTLFKFSLRVPVMLLILFLPKKGLAPSQSRVVLDWVPGRLELASAHRVLRSRFSLFRKAQNAFQVLAS
ncbi:hypothetical protein, partial [Leptospira interrogans]|uniref:hypothetical protein n=1 Tax=Leptospira interrogans TaxID=173 RepID=UPI001B8D449C